MPRANLDICLPSLPPDHMGLHPLQRVMLDISIYLTEMTPEMYHLLFAWQQLIRFHTYINML